MQLRGQLLWGKHGNPLFFLEIHSTKMEIHLNIVKSTQRIGNPPKQRPGGGGSKKAHTYSIHEIQRVLLVVYKLCFEILLKAFTCTALLVLHQVNEHNCPHTLCRVHPFKQIVGKCSQPELELGCVSAHAILSPFSELIFPA